MCTEPGTHGLTRRAALFGGAGVAAAVAVGAPAQAAAGGRGLRDLTYPLGPDTPAFSPGEEAVRRTVTTIPADGYRNAGQCSGLQAGVKARAGRAARPEQCLNRAGSAARCTA
ncbi:hypothetical protein BJY16_007044 [Actinoplanes octamycinicus]|uniref:Uncharacterized protein n=1 Tax=Actinoplanes octamycinicus TaxID=135948 RepID=A0A7W7H3Z6_9ACTN|nr:hypothetical protein [Actinoplanes octamycinicus]MBB4743585.1 hypothetical protein [Actinoplanes octamycinicus]